MKKRAMKKAKRSPVEPKRALERVGIYDAYRPRIYGTADEIQARQQGRSLIGVIKENEAFATSKEREIAARTREMAEHDASRLAMHAERARKKATRP